MCGIFGYIGKNEKAGGIVLNGLKNLEYRGYDSWGIALLDLKDKTQRLTITKRTGKIGDVSESVLLSSHFALGHTRWATHGGVTEQNAHPHKDCTGKIVIIHNGIIENYDVIKKDLLAKGHKFLSETDTEVAVHLIEDNYHDLKNITAENRQLQFKEAVRKAFNTFVGLNAIIVMDTESHTFVAAKNGSPLVIGKGEGENYLASDAHALLDYTKNIHFMEDGQLVLISEDSIQGFDAATGEKIPLGFVRLDWTTGIADKGNFRHFMLKEIYDEPRVVQDLLADHTKNIEQFAGLIQKSYGTYFVGCGTAAYACLAGTYIFSKIARRHVNFAVGSEFSYLVDYLTAKSLVIALSQSGETIDVIEAVKHAQEKNARIGALVNVLGSTLYRLANDKLLLNAGVEKAVVSTKAFTAKLANLILIAYALDHRLDQGKDELAQANTSLMSVLDRQNSVKISKLAKKIVSKEHMYIIGRGLSYPLALETALKIKEASYIHAEGFAAGELKHGVIALIEPGTPCFVFLTNDDTYGANLAGAMEMKARGGYMIGISFKPHELFDYYLPYTDCGISSVIPAIAIGQLLGYYLATYRGLDPDKPRNLAKSVTVK